MIDGRFLVPLEDSLSLFNMLLPLAMAGHRCSLKRRHENSFICHDCILGMGVSIQDWTKWIRFFQLWIQGSMGLTKMFQSYGSHENRGRVPSWVLFWEAKLMDKSRQCSRTTGICWDLGDYISSQRDSRVWKTTFARLALHLQAPDGLLPPHEELLGSGKLWHFEGSNVTGDGGGPCPKTLPKTPKSPQVSEVRPPIWVPFSQEVEGFLASGFLSLTDCLAENSFIHFSQNQGQLVETAPWPHL